MQDFAQSASRENLELGCKLIKNAVIEKALNKVREDQAIQNAIARRKQAQESGDRQLFLEENIIRHF